MIRASSLVVFTSKVNINLSLSLSKNLILPSEWRSRLPPSISIFSTPPPVSSKNKVPPSLISPPTVNLSVPELNVKPASAPTSPLLLNKTWVLLPGAEIVPVRFVASMSVK